MKDEGKTKKDLIEELSLLRQSEKSYKERLALLQSILDNIAEPISMISKDYKVVWMNPAARQLMPDMYSSDKAIMCYECHHNNKLPCHGVETPCPLKQLSTSNKSLTIVHEHYLPGGKKRAYEIIASPLWSRKGVFQGIVEAARDITKRKAMEKQLHEAAINDELTGLHNRRGFVALAEKQLKLAKRSKRNMSLLYLDLNGFKAINDELGHKTGDQALEDTAKILRKTFRESDIIARFGGDEFVVLLTELPEPRLAAVTINHLLNNLEIHNVHGGRQYELLLSIGVAHYDPHHPCSLEELLVQADEDMYENKKHQKYERRTAPTFEERRSYQRFMTSHDCQAEINASRVVIKDISIGGISVKTFQPLAPDSIHEIGVIPPGRGKIASKGVVIWSSLKETFEEDSYVPSYGAGLKFIQTNKNLKSDLEYFIKEFTADQ